MRLQALALAAALLLGCQLPEEGTPDGGADDDYTGVWHGSWSFHIDLINTGTNFARDCDFHGSTTFSIWGENNFGPVNGTQSMECSNASNPGAGFEFGGHVDGASGVISGRFYYWADANISFAGQCGSVAACSATGANGFVISLSKP
jgi:hypothetical protein